MNGLSPRDVFTPEDLIGPLNDVEEKYAPRRLYAAGDPGLLNRAPRVAIIGTRRPTDLGRRRAARLVRILVEHDITVVSGLAAGIDTVAHQTAIEAGGRTVAVLGTALDQTYPPENADLQRLIMREHLAISQFPPGFPSLPKNFPQRNRTMALISNASVIIEASKSSGVKSQGWEALRLGRPLFLTRSLLQNKSLDWPAQMMNYGAFELAEPEDLLACLPSPTYFQEQSPAF